MKKALSVFLIILLLICLVLIITGKGYVFKTLVYTYPDIDDLEIFDKRVVQNSVSSEWPVSANYNKIPLPAETDSQNILNESVAFLVVKNDSIVYEQYWDNYNDQSLSNSFSVSKSVVGILTGIAIKENLLSLEDPVGKYIPAFSTGANSSLKVQHLLSMSSGLNWDESYQSLFSKTTEAYYGSDLTRQVEGLQVVETPGKTFRYMSCNTLMLGMIISKASGQTLSEYASEKLWKPIGASHPAYWSLDHSKGTEKSYCCLYSNARDFARIGKLMLDSGKWNNNQIITTDYFIHSVTANGCVDESGMPVDYYGWQWWLTEVDGKKIIYARGILGQYIIAIPEERIIIVRLGKKRGEKNERNQYNDMVSYTNGVLSSFGSKQQ